MLLNVVARDGVEPFWGVCYQSNPLESRTALPFRDSRDRLTVQIQYTVESGIRLPPSSASADEYYTSAINSLCLCGLQAYSILGYSFYSFSNSLYFL